MKLLIKFILIIGFLYLVTSKDFEINILLRQEETKAILRIEGEFPSYSIVLQKAPGNEEKVIVSNKNLMIIDVVVGDAMTYYEEHEFPVHIYDDQRKVYKKALLSLDNIKEVYSHLNSSSHPFKFSHLRFYNANHIGKFDPKFNNSGGSSFETTFGLFVNQVALAKKIIGLVGSYEESENDNIADSFVQLRALEIASRLNNDPFYNDQNRLAKMKELLDIKSIDMLDDFKFLFGRVVESYDNGIFSGVYRAYVKKLHQTPILLIGMMEKGMIEKGDLVKDGLQMELEGDQKGVKSVKGARTEGLVTEVNFKRLKSMKKLRKL
jgi:hypothetical protein